MAAKDTPGQMPARFMIEADELIKSGAFNQVFLQNLSSLCDPIMYKNSFADLLYMISLKGKVMGKGNEYTDAIQDFANLIYEIKRRFDSIEKFNKEEQSELSSKLPKKKQKFTYIKTKK